MISLKLGLTLMYVVINIMGNFECKGFVGITVVAWRFCQIIPMFAGSHHVYNPSIGIRNTYVFVFLLNIVIQNEFSSVLEIVNKV